MTSRIEELLGGFRARIPDQLGGVFDVGKQDGDLFPFAFQGTASGENVFRQVFGRMGDWLQVHHTPLPALRCTGITR
jgi:hypothetical protein